MHVIGYSSTIANVPKNRGKKFKLSKKCSKQSIMCMFEYLMYMFKNLMYMFKNLMYMFEYLEISKITIFPGGSQKSDWTQTFALIPTVHYAVQ